MAYYDSISEGYEELHGEEQLKKVALIKKHIKNTFRNFAKYLVDFLRFSNLTSDFIHQRGVLGIDDDFCFFRIKTKQSPPLIVIPFFLGHI